MLVDGVEIPFALDTFTAFCCIGAVLFSFLLVMVVSEFGKNLISNQQPLGSMRKVGIAVFVLQLFGVYILWMYDYGRVGGVDSSNNPLVIFYSYLHIDAIFLVYYGHRRGNGVPIANLFLYLFSSTLSGWSGIWLVLFLIESYYLIHRLSLKKFLVVGSLISFLGILAYPSINNFKESIRGVPLQEQLTFQENMERLATRLQHVTAVFLIAQETENISRAMQNREVLLPFVDNTVGAKMFAASESSSSLSKYLSANFLIDLKKYGSNSVLDELGWYVHTGIAGWFFVLDWFMWPVYVFFVVLLIIAPYWINARFVGSASMIPVLHVAALGYVFHGWFSPQIGFITGMIWYVLIWMLARDVNRPCYYNNSNALKIEHEA